MTITGAGRESAMKFATRPKYQLTIRPLKNAWLRRVNIPNHVDICEIWARSWSLNSVGSKNSTQKSKLLKILRASRGLDKLNHLGLDWLPAFRASIKIGKVPVKIIQSHSSHGCSTMYTDTSIARATNTVLRYWGNSFRQCPCPEMAAERSSYQTKGISVARSEPYTPE